MRVETDSLDVKISSARIRTKRTPGIVEKLLSIRALQKKHGSETSKASREERETAAIAAPAANASHGDWPDNETLDGKGFIEFSFAVKLLEH